VHDLSIRGALILDGLGGEPRVADLAVKDGKIAAIGQSLPARESIDAAGLALIGRGRPAIAALGPGNGLESTAAIAESLVRRAA